MDVAFLSDLFYKRFPKLFSVVFHPLVMPTIGLYLIFHSGTHISFLPDKVKNSIMAVVLICTLVLPLTFIPIYYYRKMIDRFEMDNHKERLIPMAVTAMMYYVAFFLLRRWGVPVIIQAFILASTLVVFITLLITLYWKVSIHAAGIGGIIGLIICMSVGYRVDMVFYLMIAIALSGIIGFSRLSLNAHTPIQVYFGLAIGFLVTVTTISIY